MCRMGKHTKDLADFKKRVERFIVRTGMAPSAFGRRALKSPRFVWFLREGRRPTAETMDRVDAFMIKHERQTRKRAA